MPPTPAGARRRHVPLDRRGSLWKRCSRFEGARWAVGTGRVPVASKACLESEAGLGRRMG